MPFCDIIFLNNHVLSQKKRARLFVTARHVSQPRFPPSQSCQFQQREQITYFLHFVFMNATFYFSLSIAGKDHTSPVFDVQNRDWQAKGSPGLAGLKPHAHHQTCAVGLVCTRAESYQLRENMVYIKKAATIWHAQHYDRERIKRFRIMHPITDPDTFFDVKKCVSGNTQAYGVHHVLISKDVAFFLSKHPALMATFRFFKINLQKQIN